MLYSSDGGERSKMCKDWGICVSGWGMYDSLALRGIA
jgi:hypothetical protein